MIKSQKPSYPLHLKYKLFLGRVGRRKFTLGSLYDIEGLRPSAVDVYARIILPGAFVAFQIVYWITCFYLMPAIPEGTILLKKKYESNDAISK